MRPDVTVKGKFALSVEVRMQICFAYSRRRVVTVSGMAKPLTLSNVRIYPGNQVRLRRFKDQHPLSASIAKIANLAIAEWLDRHLPPIKTNRK